MKKYTNKQYAEMAHQANQTGKLLQKTDDGELIFVDPPEPTIEELSQQVRQKRDGFLIASDKNVLPDRWAMMTQDQQSKWTEYRQYLRDIPQQEEFPNIEVMSFEEFQQDLE